MKDNNKDKNDKVSHNERVIIENAIKKEINLRNTIE